MTSPTPDRICTLCHTQFRASSTRGVGCAVGIVGFGATVALATGLRLDGLAALGLGVAAWVVSVWVERAVRAARVQTCPSCGSRLTVLLSSPAGAALSPPAAPVLDLAAEVPQAPALPKPPPEQTQVPRAVGVVLFLVLLALLGVVAYTVHRNGGW